MVLAKWKVWAGFYHDQSWAWSLIDLLCEFNLADYSIWMLAKIFYWEGQLSTGATAVFSGDSCHSFPSTSSTFLFGIRGRIQWWGPILADAIQPHGLAVKHSSAPFHPVSTSPWKPLTLSGHTQTCHRNQWIEQSCPRKRLFLLGQFFWLHWLALFICLFVSGGFSVCLSVSVTGFPVLSQTQQKAWDRGWDDWGDFTVWFLAGTAKLGFWPIPYPIWEQCDSHTPWLPLTQGTHSHRAHKFSPVYVLLRNSFCHVEVATQTEPITVSWAN